MTKTSDLALYAMERLRWRDPQTFDHLQRLLGEAQDAYERSHRHDGTPA